RVPPTRYVNAKHFLSRLVTKRLMAFVMLGSVGLTIVGILIANIAISAIRSWMIHWHMAGTVFLFFADVFTTMLLNTIAFAVLYKSLPKKRVHWSDAFRSAMLVAITWEVGREFLCSFLIGMRYTTTYGAVGSFIALLLWFYWGVNILLFGAEYLQVIGLRRNKPLSMFDPKYREQRMQLAVESVTPRKRAA
ncbi:MAG: YihY/virulence factor BrkB family protein, partial [Planctomycetota bacterium]